MPKWVYDNKTMTMVPQQKRGLEFAMTGEGMRVKDYDNNIEFVITRNDEVRLPGRGMKVDCKRYGTREAHQIAERVRRVFPHSKYVDFRYFAKGFPIEEKLSVEDKALLRSISESYEPGNVLEYVEHLNEETGVLFNVGHTASTEHNFKDHKEGIRGLLQAAPSAILSFLVCPPAALLALIGAVHRRSEQRWAKSIFNHNRWKDLVAYPVERKKAVDKLREKMAANCKYYYTRLANGEILRVVGCSTLEAKEMVMAVERKDIIPRYKEYNTKLALTDEPRDASTGPTAIVNYDPEKYVMWVIKFDNGEACYAFGLPDYSDKEDIMEAAVKSREAMVEYYKKIVYRDEDNKEKKKQKHVGIDTEKDEDSEQVKRLFKVPKIDDMVQIENPATYKIINETNFKEFTEPRTSPLTWEPAGKTYYNIKIGELGDIILPLKDEAEVKAVLGRITDLGGAFAQKIREYATEIVNNNVSYYQCVNGTNSYFYIPYVSASTGDALDTGTANEAKNRATELFNIIGEIITNNNAEMKESLISPGTIKAYNTDYAPKRAARVCKPAGTEINNNGDTIEHYTADWPTKIKYQQFDSRSNDSLTEVIEYKDAKADTTWPTRTRRNAEQQTDTTTDASSNAI